MHLEAQTKAPSNESALIQFFLHFFRCGFLEGILRKMGAKRGFVVDKMW